MQYIQPIGWYKGFIEKNVRSKKKWNQDRQPGAQPLGQA